MAGKTSGIPPQKQWNMTGGLPHALLDVGVLGNPMTGAYALYAVAGRDLESRELNQGADYLAAEFIKSLYDTWGPELTED
ncbi:hypothetical protein [Alicyclobacillus suci]|uniref:hypothetical protein n=1 Tax=Alicyclobacillus suci TaxID=2816080 RepID=UPI001A906BFE|nr:hypothetical protein [Alicyclobacillus suci]